MNIINVVLYLILSLFSFECNAQPAPAAPAAPQYPAAQPPKAKAAKESKDKKEAHGRQEDQKRLIMHNAMIFLDVNEKTDVIMNDFALAVCQNGHSILGYPIIVTSYIYNNAVTSHQTAALMQSIFTFFEVYKTYSGDFYLLIPKTYFKHLEQLYSKEKQELRKIEGFFKLNDFLTGFALSGLKKINDPGADFINVSRMIDIKSLQSLFIQKKDIAAADSELLGMWNFVIMGHGYYSKQLLDLIQTGLLPNQMKELAEDRFADASIAGLKLNQYRALIQFFIRNIHTHFLYYSSCYAGGYNTILGYIDALINSRGNIAVQAKPNFIIASGALTDTETYGVSTTDLDYCLSCIKKSRRDLLPISFDTCLAGASKQFQGAVNYVDFFNKLHTYARKDRLAGTIFKEQELRDILDSIMIRDAFYRLQVLAGIPQVMFPGTDIFRAVDIDGTISVITESMVKAHQLETEDKKPIIVKDKRAILIYPLVVPVEINISTNQQPLIVSMSPMVSLQKFEKITCNTLTFYRFIEAIGSLKLAFDKYIYIKELIVQSDQYGLPLAGSVTVRKNVLINIKENSVIVVYCTEQGNIVQEVYELPLKNNAIVKRLDSPFFDVVKSQDTFLDVAVNYFSIEEIKKLFSYDTIFVKLLYPRDLAVINNGIKELENEKKEHAQKKRIEDKKQMLAGAARFHPSYVNINEIDAALKDYYEPFPDILFNPSIKSEKLGMTPLAMAITKRDVKAADALLRLGVNIDRAHKEEGFITPLMLAVMSNFIPMVELLLERDADITLKNKEGKTAQDMVSNAEMKKVFEDFKKHGQEPQHEFQKEEAQPRTRWTAMHAQVADLLSIASPANIEQAAALIAQRNLDIDVKNADGESLRELVDAMNRTSNAVIKYQKSWQALMKAMGVKSQEIQEPQAVWTKEHEEVTHLLSISSAQNIDRAAGIIMAKKLNVDIKNADGESLKDLADAMNRSSRAEIKYPKSWDMLMKAMDSKPQEPQAVWTKEHEEVAHLLSISSAQNIDKAADMIMAKKLNVKSKNADGETLKDMAESMNRASKASVKYPDAWNKLMKVLD